MRFPVPIPVSVGEVVLMPVPAFGIFDFLRSFGFSYADDDDAQGQTQRAGSINADITTLVVDILENGNLQIEGTKKIKVNGEEQIIKLSGIVRREDITKENNCTILENCQCQH